MKRRYTEIKSVLSSVFILFFLASGFYVSGQDVIMSNTTLSTCGGIFFDSGGSTGDYAANESITMTLCSDGSTGTHIQLTFLEPNLGPGDDLCFYDGTDATAPELSCASVFGGDSFIIQATAANPSGCLTLVFTSDGTGEGAGWGADINCITACQNIFAELTSTTPAVMPADTGYMDVCQGERVYFSAQGLYPQNGIAYQHSDFTSEFHWDFGDGATSVGPNASHIYNTSEGFTVQLTIIDQFGCRSLNSINQRIRVSTTPEFNLETIDPICVGDTIHLGGTVDTIHHLGHNVSAIPVEGSFVKDPVVCDSLPLPDGTGVAYVSTINYTQFAPGAILTNINDLLSIFVNMEHSWMRDLEISLTCPDGTEVILHDHPGNFGGEVFCGVPFEGDTGANPSPGEGWDYFWTPNSTNGTWIEYANNNAGIQTLPSQDYEAFDDLEDLLGCPLNGNWSISVEDLWGADNGYIFCWGVEFDESLFPEIETYTPGIDTFGWAFNPQIFEQIHMPPLDSIVTAPQNAGTAAFTFYVLDSFGCNYEVPLSVEVLPETHPDCHNCEDNVSIPNDVVICAGDTVQFDVSGSLELETQVTFESVPYYQIGFSNHPPSSPYNSTINVNSIAPAQITDATTLIESVCIDLETDYDGDMQIFLQAPSGETLELSTGNGGSGDNYTNTCFTPNAATPITAGSAPFTGDFQPEGSWTTLNGADMTGTWTLLVGDQFGFNEMGILNSWSITFNSMNSITYDWMPGIDISCTDCPDPEVYPSTSTSYIVEAQDQYGCINLDTIQVDVVSEVPAPIVTCASVGNGQMSFSWPDNPGVSSYNINIIVNGMPSGWQTGVTDNPYIVTGLNFGDEVTMEIQVNSTGTGITCDVATGTSTCTYSECGPDDEILIDSVVINHVACFGTETGAATIFPSNGIEPYFYAWDDPDMQVLQTASFLAAGTYNVTVTDNIFCMTEVEVVITEPDELVLSIDGEDASCFGFSDGTGTVTPQGGTSPYFYQWTNGEITQSVDNLPSGMHQVEVTDANGCMETIALTTGEPATAVTVSVDQSYDGCNGADDNEATAVGAGGTGPGYTYLWSDDQQGATAIDLSPGSISVTVTDEQGCTAEASVDLFDLEPLYGDIIISEPTCNGYPDGSLGVNNFGGGAGVDGEEGDYSFSWSNGDSGVVTENVVGGLDYEVTIQDANGCTVVVSRFLPDPDPLTFEVLGDDANCNNAADGSASIFNITGNQGDVSILWDALAGSQQTLVAENLSFGTYGVTLTDENGCMSSATVGIDHPTELELTYNTVDNDCFGDAIGEIETYVSGGTPGYVYAWPTQEITPNISGLPAGIYEVTIIDESDCVLQIPIEITQPEPLVADIAVEDVTCFGDRDGTIYATPQGGVPPYQFSLDNSTYVGSSTLIGLTAGHYNVFMKDANDCMFITDALISEPEEFMVDAGPDVTITLGDEIQIEATSENGAGEVMYVWYPPYDSTMSCVECIAPIFFPQNTLIYELYGVDENGCDDTDLLTITVAKPRSAMVPTGFSPNSDGVNDVLQVHGLPGTMVKVFRVYDRWGELLYENFDFEVNSGIGWDGKFKGETMQPGVYLWSMVVEYPYDNETAELMGETTLIR